MDTFCTENSIVLGLARMQMVFHCWNWWGKHLRCAFTELAMQVSELTKQMKKMYSMMENKEQMRGQTQGQLNPKEVCAICGNFGHEANTCSSRGNFPDYLEQVDMMNS